MNDRAVSVLESYEIEIRRTFKGRGAILCESDKGLLILKEYTGPAEKAAFQDMLLTSIKQQGFSQVESIIKNKEGELITYDHDRVPYILKTYFEGRECNVRDEAECIQAVQTLACLHKASEMTGCEELDEKLCFCIDKEYEKHNRELRRVRKYLKEKSQKTNFEIYLLNHYDYFYNIALQVTEEVRFYLMEAKSGEQKEPCIICHGDYQYHNLLLQNGQMAVVNFEKCLWDNPVRDLYLFMRKLMEKSNWSQELSDLLLNSYNQERQMDQADYAQLYYRFSYPEKFWKIVNFYYNTGKAWIPGRNMEKLEKLMEQEKEKQLFLENYKNTYGRFSFNVR